MMLRYRIDTVQFNGYLESWLIPLVRMFGRRAVRTAHGPTEIDRYRWYSSPISYFPRFGSMLCMRAASKVVCVSHAVYADTAGHVDASRLSVVSNWVQPPTRLRDRSQLNSPPAVLYVGRLERYKGLHLLIEAVRNLPHPVHLIVVGDGRDRAHLQGLASGMHCDFMGFLPNTADFYYSSDLFVNPSLGPEGLPIVSLEAMASGIPCIFSALPVHSEISAQGKGAALCKVDDVQDLTSALERLLFHTNERVTLSDNAQEIVRKRYSPTVALKGYLAALQILQLTVDL
jgi:glycosyltransferase involved in cell wall biosynthesis